MGKNVLEIKNLSFSYSGATRPVFDELSWNLPACSRVLLCGPNGAGKTTLLRLIGGGHLISRESLRVNGGSPFHEPAKTQGIQLVDGDFPLTLDLSVQELLEHPSPGVVAKRQSELIEILGIDRTWRMHQVSDGQRKRVQLLLALRHAWKLLLLDEVTTHLDLLVRGRLLKWLKQEQTRSKATIIYTTHILDGLWTSHTSPWATHIAYLDSRGLQLCEKPARIAELQKLARTRVPSPLLQWVENQMKASERGLTAPKKNRGSGKDPRPARPRGR